MVQAGNQPRPMAIVGFQLWLFIFVAFAGTTLIASFPTLRAGAVLLYVVPLIVWAAVWMRVRLDRLTVAILVGLVAHVLVSFFSRDPMASLEASGAVAAYAVVFWLARHIASNPTWRRVAAISITLALTLWIVVIATTWLAEKVVDVQVLGWPPRLDAYQAYSWGSINTPPAMLLLIAPFVAWTPRGWLRRVVLTLLLASAVVIVPFSGGRAAWLAMAVAAVSFEVMSGAPATRALARQGTAGRVLLVAVGISVVAATALVISRLGRLADDMLTRVRLWEQAIGLFAADPVTGSGPSTFGWARLQQAPDFVDRVGVTMAHNVALQTLADGGLVLAIGLVVVVVAWASVVFSARHALDVRQRLAIAVLIGYAAFTLLDDLNFLPAVTVLLITIAAWALPTEPTPARQPPRGALRLLAPATVIAVALLSAPAAVSLSMLRIELADARAAALAGDWETGLRGFQRATEVQPASALNWMSVGVLEHHLGREEAAVAAYEMARAANPGDPRPWGALAALASNDDERTRLLEEASRRANDPQYAYRLGSVLAAAGDAEGAAAALAIAVVLRPDLVATLPPELQDDVSAQLPMAIALVGPIERSNPNEAAWNMALLHGELAADAPPAWEVAHLVDVADPSGSDSLARARDVAPTDVRTLGAAMAVAWAKCDHEAFEQAETRHRLVDVKPGLRSHGFEDRRAGLYGEPELGDYQPLTGRSIPLVPPWPLGLIELPDCGW